MDEVFATEPLDQPAPTRRVRPLRIALAATATAMVVAGAAVGVHLATPPTPALAGGSLQGDQTAQTALNGSNPGGSNLSGSNLGGSDATSATVAQQIGVVDIDTVLGYQNAKAAGTGLVLTSTGEILTNNHVIAGATSISVTIVSTGRTYTAKVVGYDVTADLAVLQLSRVSGLATAHIAATSTVSLGESVVGGGNAGGVGGTPRAAAGTVVATDQDIVAADEGRSSSEQLTGLIETDAQIAAGDSGGPLFNSDDAVIGIDTAASTGSSVRGYAIEIHRALAVAAEIEAGRASSTVHIGTTAMLGVEVAGSSVTQVAGVVDGSPAAAAGLQAGDLITSIAGHRVTTPASLSARIAALHAGDRVSLRWTDFSGVSHHATITVQAGPAL